MVEVGAMLLLASLLANLVAAPYYYRKLYRLIEALEQYSPDTYAALQRPSLKKLGYKMTPSSSMSLVGFVWKKSYIETKNSVVIQAGEKAFKGLVISVSAMSIMFLAAALITSSANV